MDRYQLTEQELNHIDEGFNTDVPDWLTYSLEELEEMESLEQGYTCDLKDSFTTAEGSYKVWLARTTMLDGEFCDNKVTIEHLNERSQWETLYEYEAV